MVGGGEVGCRKVKGLLGSGAVVQVVSRELDPELEKMRGAGEIEYLGPDYSPEHLDGVSLAYAASGDSGLNEQIGRDAEKKGIWVNVVDDPDLCSFTVPASISRGDLTISVSTNGRSPALSAAIRKRLEKEFGDEYSSFLKLMGLVRNKVLSEGRASNENRLLFRRLVDSRLLDALASSDYDRADSILIEFLGPEYSFESLGFDPKAEAES